MTISQDSLILLLLFSHLGITDEDLKPFTLRDWKPLARKLQAASLQPADLLAVPFAKGAAPFSDEEVSRIAQLVARTDPLHHELKRLARLGIFALTKADEDYPQRYHQRLKDAAPPVLFYAGEKALLGQPGIAVVGSRHLDAAGQDCASMVGNICGNSGQVLYSGGARGVDTLSMEAALDARGAAVGVLADSLEKAARARKEALSRGDLCLVTPYSPNAGFSVGAAMGRNRLIYTLADHAIVVASDAETGGTWAGAIETIKNGWLPVFALEHPAMPEGNKLLLKKGAIPFPYPFKAEQLKLSEWLRDHSPRAVEKPSQPSLF